LLSFNLRLACESLQNIWNAKMLELFFPFSRFADRNIEIFQSPFQIFSRLRVTGTLKIFHILFYNFYASFNSNHVQALKFVVFNFALPQSLPTLNRSRQQKVLSHVEIGLRPRSYYSTCLG
jgi:hypothetical protein